MVGYARPVQQSLNVINAEKQGVLILKTRDVPRVLLRRRKLSVTNKKGVSGVGGSVLWMHERMMSDEISRRKMHPSLIVEKMPFCSNEEGIYIEKCCSIHQFLGEETLFGIVGASYMGITCAIEMLVLSFLGES